MAELQLFEQDGLELIIDTTTGESFASVSGYARMSGKDKSTISRRLESVAESIVNTAEIVTGYGLRTVSLISEDLIVSWLPKDNPELASKMMKAGVRLFLHGLAGFKYELKQENKSKDSDELDLLTRSLDLIFSGLHIPKEIVAQEKLNAVQKLAPAIASYLEPSRQLLINSTATKKRLMSVTDLGKQLNPPLSAVALNKLLITNGFQVENVNKKSKKDPRYLPTTKGEPYSELTRASCSNNSGLAQQLRWYDSILSLLNY